MKRTFIESTDIVGTLDTNRIVFDNGSEAILSDRLICLKCRNILWKPVSCGICAAIFCEKCRPRKSVFKNMLSFFKTQRSQHQKDNCDDFEEVLAPHDITTNLGRLRVRCVYDPNGCQVILPYNTLEEHERQCEFERVPCRVCQLPLSKRPPVVEHTLRVCFEELMRKNPAPMQQQFMQLMNATEKVDVENRRLQSMIHDLRVQLNTLDAACVKRNVVNNK